MDGADFRPLQVGSLPDRLRLPLLRAVMRGRAGSGEGRRNLCVADSILQLMLQRTSAMRDPGAQAGAYQLAQQVRHLAGVEGEGPIHTGDAWVVFVARAFASNAPRPVLLELPLADSSTGRVHTDHVEVHGTPGPWDGTVVCIVSDNAHTEPVWWPPHAGGSLHVTPHGLSARAVVATGEGPARVRASHGLSEAIVAGLYLGVRIAAVATRRAPSPWALPGGEEALAVETSLRARADAGDAAATVIMVVTCQGNEGPIAPGLERARLQAMQRGEGAIVVLHSHNGSAIGVLDAPDGRERIAAALGGTPAVVTGRLQT